MKKIIMILAVILVLTTACAQQVADSPAPQDENQQETMPSDEDPMQDDSMENVEPEQEEEQDMYPEEGSGEAEELPVKEIRLEAYQFGFEPSTITVKKGQTVKVTAISTDVGHGIAIPEFGVSQAMPVGEEVTFEFTPDQTGTFRFYCNVYCGSGHSSMDGTLVVEE